jgi:two-component system, OmpR family, phosphate regulon sensor histidine kinase PhoR
VHSGRLDLGTATRVQQDRIGRSIWLALALLAALALLVALRTLSPEADALGIAVAALCGGLLALLWNERRERALRELAEAARRMADGDLAARAPTRGAAPLSEVGAVLNQMAASYAERLQKLYDDRDLAARILEGMGEGVLVLDRRGRVLLANRAARSLLLLGADAVGKTLIEAVRNVALQELLAKATHSEEPLEREVAQGGIFPRRLRVRAAALGDLVGEPGVLAVLHDVTDLRRLETIRTDFVANVSHELRTPVTAISTAVETLLGGALADAEESRELSLMIDRQAKRLRQLVDDLLDLSRIEARGFRPKLVDIEVVAVAEHAVRLLEDPARRRGVRLRVVSEGPLRALADRRGVEQVLQNLLDNAVKYGGEHGNVEVRVAADGDQVVVAVHDDGPGIAASHLERIFERFYRIDAGRSRELGGTGLGLSIVKHLVESMRGTVEVQSEVGKGSIFRVRLPRAA